MPDAAPESCTPDLVYGLICDGPNQGEWWEIGIDGTPIPDRIERTVQGLAPGQEKPRVVLSGADWRPKPAERTVTYRVFDHAAGEPVVAIPMNLGERGHLVVIIPYRVDSDPASADLGSGENPRIPMSSLKDIAVDFSGQLAGTGRFHHEPAPTEFDA